MDVKIEGVGPKVDGVYELDPSSVTMREYHEIKLMTGQRLLELPVAVAFRDASVMVAYALLALRRADKDVDVDVLWDAKGGAIQLIFPDEEEQGDADGPPASEPAGNGGGSPEDSGETSSSSSERQATGPSRTGPRGSGTSATSGPGTSGS